MPIPNWLKNLFSNGVIASFVYSEEVDISADDHEIVIKDSIALALYVGSSGDVKLINPAGDTVTYKNVQVGTHPFACTRIIKNGTSASDIVAGAW